IAMTLAQSEEPEDRTLAVQTMRYLRGAPVARERPADALEPAPAPEHRVPVGRTHRGLDHRDTAPGYRRRFQGSALPLPRDRRAAQIAHGLDRQRAVLGLLGLGQRHGN